LTPGFGLGRARSLVGLAGYVTNLRAETMPAVISQSNRDTKRNVLSQVYQKAESMPGLLGPSSSFGSPE
jgi:hypothetical protein